MVIRRTVLFVVAAALAGCTSAPVPTVSLPPSTTLGPASEPLVAFEASWLCQVQRFTFAEAGDIDVELEAALHNQGASLDEYENFKERLDGAPELRAEIRQRFESQCLVSESVVDDETASES